MFIGYAIETLRAEVPLNAASTPAVEAVLAAGYGNDVGESNKAMARTPRLGLQQTSSFRSERRSCKRSAGGGPDQSPVLWAGMLYAPRAAESSTCRAYTRLLQPAADR
jgi:hypothetical protein